MQSHQIPNALHFIWYGSVIHDEQAERVRQWKQLNPHYDVNVWYDPKLLSAEQIYEFQDWANNNGIILNDINTLAPNEHGVYESAGPFPNYAARSDIDRCRILYDSGGIYMDIDIAPTQLKLPLFETTTGLMFNGFMQGEHIDGITDIKPGRGSIGNDLMASVKHHPRLRDIISIMQETYDHSKPFLNLSEIVTQAFVRTLSKTGPIFLRQVLFQLELTDTPDETAQFKNEAYYLDGQYFDCTENDLSWLESEATAEDEQEEESTVYKLILKKYDSNKAFIDDVNVRISYEYKYFGTTFLNDYLRYAPSELTQQDLTNIYQGFISQYKSIPPPNILFSLKDQLNDIATKLDTLNIEHKFYVVFLTLQKLIENTNWQTKDFLGNPLPLNFELNSLPFPIKEIYEGIDSALNKHLRGESVSFQAVFNNINNFIHEQELLRFPLGDNVKKLLTIITLSFSEMMDKLYVWLDQLENQNLNNNNNNNNILRI